MSSKDHLILFGDLIGSTEVASETPPRIYSRIYIGSFHLASYCAKSFVARRDVFRSLMFPKIFPGVKMGGDEVLSFIPLPSKSVSNGHRIVEVVASSVAFAFVLKLYWLASPYNLRRLLEKQFPRDVAVGIHIGPAEPIRNYENHSDIAGLHINVTKRLETAARDGRHSRIYASDDVAHLFGKWCAQHSDLGRDKAAPLLYTHFCQVQLPIDLKGVPVKVTPFELKLDEKSESKIQDLISLIYDSPTKQNCESEKAVRILARTLLEGIFKKRSDTRDFAGVSNELEYVDRWFHAIETLPRLFYNDIWTVLASFFLSCGFIRQKNITSPKKDRYQKITETLQKRLRSLIEESNNQG